ncbi:MAG: 50S ribosomal protein L34e [Ignisphaera sp.]
MAKPGHRSRSYKRIYRRTPSGRTALHYERRKNTPMKCSRCGNILAGVPIKETERKSLPKTAKRPERIYGGVLCPRCLKVVLKRVVRGKLISTAISSTQTLQLTTPQS